MPGGTFQGAVVKTVVLFFEKGAPTRKVWFYQLKPGRNMGKTNALINAGIVPGLKPGANLQTTTYAFPAGGGLASTGAFGVCGALTAAAAGSFNVSALGALAIAACSPPKMA